MPWITSNAYLSLDDQKNNAVQLVYNLHSRGWSLEACSGMLGNMQTESTINPGIWQDLKEGNMDGGFGLVQWTPARDFIAWCESEGLPYANGDTQCDRFEFELENHLQYYPTTRFPETFAQFKESTKSPYYLGQAFCANYERPKAPDLDARGKQSEFWYEYITGNTPPPRQGRKMPIYFYNKIL
jgi:hypothetical protein